MDLLEVGEAVTQCATQNTNTENIHKQNASTFFCDCDISPQSTTVLKNPTLHI